MTCTRRAGRVSDSCRSFARNDVASFSSVLTVASAALDGEASMASQISSMRAAWWAARAYAWYGPCATRWSISAMPVEGRFPLPLSSWRSASSAQVRDRKLRGKLAHAAFDAVKERVRVACEYPRRLRVTRRGGGRSVAALLAPQRVECRLLALLRLRGHGLSGVLPFPGSSRRVGRLGKLGGLFRQLFF
mmetsp:Transcript_16187/g.50199  ORF Transcript_16187/g.50199 Transcript_16187/m.50199 type:complete len:190 (-) Transcript_16187:1226-1795(-)